METEESTPPDDHQYIRTTPMNELDLQLMIVDSEWGQQIAPELSLKLSTMGVKPVQSADGKMYVPKEKLWGLLSYYTRDMRLGNLDKDSYIISVEWLEYAGVCLRLDLVKSFLSSLSMVITMLELSQSRNGFLRKRLGTFTQEHFNEFSDTDKKKGLFNKNPKGGQ